MNEKKKIIVFSSNFNSENGQSVVTRRVVKSILPELGGSLNCVYISGASPISIFSWLISCLKMLLGLLVFKVEVVYIVCSRTTVGFIRDLPALLMIFFGKRVVVHCHGSDLNDLLTRSWLSRLAILIYKRCEVIVPCLIIRDQIRKKVRHVHICENFYNGHISKINDTKDFSRLLVVWNSNIMATKGFLDVLYAIDILNSSGVPVDLLAFGKTIGDCEMSENKIRGEINNFQDRNWFSYIGTIDHSQAVEKLKDADVVALPSRYASEMQPLALIEGMCSAKKIVTSNTASLTVTVGSYPADFVPINDVQALVHCFKKLYLEKVSDKFNFSLRTTAAAKLSRKRFSKSRFDLELKKILLKN